MVYAVSSHDFMPLCLLSHCHVLCVCEMIVEWGGREGGKEGGIMQLFRHVVCMCAMCVSGDRGRGRGRRGMGRVECVVRTCVCVCVCGRNVRIMYMYVLDSVQSPSTPCPVGLTVPVRLAVLVVHCYMC